MEPKKSSLENLELRRSQLNYFQNMRQLQIEDLYFTGAKKIKRRKNQDERGYLSRLFCFEELKRKKISFNIKQINLTLTKKKGTIRGLHYQLPPHSEIKIVTCIKGEIFDVIIDLRKGSPTFLKKYSLKLSQKNMKSLVIQKTFKQIPEARINPKAFHPRR